MKRSLTEMICKLGSDLFLAGAIVVFFFKIDIEQIRDLVVLSRVIIVFLLAVLFIICLMLVLCAICRIWLLIRWKKLDKRKSFIDDLIYSKIFRMEDDI